MVYQLRKQQVLAAGMEEVWDFISSPSNLPEITPPHMKFEITSFEMPEKMYPGMIVTYRLKPVSWIRVAWVTEITHMRQGEYFVDEQRAGPYTMWHHEHFIEPVENGVQMTDIVTYRLPLGFLGRLAHRLFIRRQLEEIFLHRKEALENWFRNTGITGTGKKNRNIRIQ
jgi:ligand-binding SRPBCC domain-containing protein